LHEIEAFQRCPALANQKIIFSMFLLKPCVPWFFINKIMFFDEKQDFLINCVPTSTICLAAQHPVPLVSAHFNRSVSKQKRFEKLLENDKIRIRKWSK